MYPIYLTCNPEVSLLLNKDIFYMKGPGPVYGTKCICVICVRSAVRAAEDIDYAVKCT